MKPLHSSYGSAGPWKLERAADGSELRLNFNARPTHIAAGVLLAICSGAALFISFQLPPDAHMKGAMIAIFLLTGLTVPGIMAARAHEESGRNPLLTYLPGPDILRVSAPAMEISPASGRVSFSFEEFIRQGHSFEFNLVVDGERTKFLSALSADPFRALRSQISEMGFHVSGHVIKL